MIVGTKRTEAEYRNIAIDSSSSLKEFSLDRKKYYKKYIKNEKTEEEEQSKASIIGRICETLLFEPSEFDNRFYLSACISAPTANMLLFVEALYKHTAANTDENGDINLEFSEIAKLAHKDSGYKWTLEKVLEKFIGSDAELWYKEIREVRSKGLTVVTVEDINNSEKTVTELKTNEFTAPILNLVNSDRYTIYTQLQIEGYEIDGLPLKSMIDFLVIDSEEKTITPYDLKVVWAVEGFFTEYYLYRRSYIQAFLYKEACKELKIREGLEYYTVMDLKFIVADSINYYNPLVYALSGDDMDDAYNGFEYNGRKYPGVKSIIEELKWAKENSKWNISKKNYQNNGIVNIKD